MNALQVFQQNFNLDNDAAAKLAESNTIQNTEDETTVATPITQVNTTITTTQVSTTAEVLPEVTTAVKVQVATTTTEKIKPSSDSVTTTTSTIRQRTQKRLTNSKFAIFRYFGGSQKRKSYTPTTTTPTITTVPTTTIPIPPSEVPTPETITIEKIVTVPKATTKVPVTTSLPKEDGNLKILSMVPPDFDKPRLRLRLLLHTQAPLKERNFLLEVDPDAPLSVFNINVELLKQPEWPANLHFNQIKITEWLRKPHMKRVYNNLNGMTSRKVRLQYNDSLTMA